jgi:signal peptidase
MKTKVWSWVYQAILGILLIIGALLVFSKFPIPGNYKIMTVLSGSMEPTVKTGSIVVVKPEKNYKVGQIITFQLPRYKVPITHRIFEIDRAQTPPVYITKGDANNSPDSWRISENQIVGKVLFSMPYLGYLVDFVKKPIGFITLIIIPAGLIIFDEIRKITKELKRKRTKQ